jgi:hypothetical protein
MFSWTLCPYDIAVLPQTCKICKQQGGAVIECAECQKPVHASCAWLSNYKFGFELVLVSYIA